MAFGLAAATGVTWIAMSLWNALMPEIFGLRTITFWQALGLLLLSRLFLGGFRHPRGRWRRPRFVRGWQSLTPEERERFREAMTPEQRERFRGRMRRCGIGDAPPDPAPRV